MMEEILNWIEQADDIQISRVIQSVIRRYDRIYPDHDVVFLSLPKNDPQERRQVLQGALDMLGRTEE